MAYTDTLATLAATGAMASVIFVCSDVIIAYLSVCLEIASLHHNTLNLLVWSVSVCLVKTLTSDTM